MKRTLSLFLTVALILALTACGSTGGQNNAGPDPAPEGNTPASTTPETPPANQRSDTTPTEEQAPEGTDGSGKKILTVYFSATNNTEGIANHLNEILEPVFTTVERHLGSLFPAILHRFPLPC